MVGEHEPNTKTRPMREPLSSDHKAQLWSDGIHAFVVLFVVIATTILALVGASVPQDVVGTVFGGALGYAAGRAGSIARTRPGPITR